MPVESTRSQNITVTWRRSPRRNRQSPSSNACAASLSDGSIELSRHPGGSAAPCGVAGNLPRQVQTSTSTRGSRAPAGKTPSRVWTLVIVGGLSRYRGTEPNVDVSFDCGPRPDYRVLIVGFRSARHTLSSASPSDSRPPYLLGSARRRPFAGTPGHVGEMCLTDSSLRMPCRRKFHQPAILIAWHGVGSGAPEKIFGE